MCVIEFFSLVISYCLSRQVLLPPSEELELSAQKGGLKKFEDKWYNYTLEFEVRGMRVVGYRNVEGRLENVNTWGCEGRNREW
ncbi:hypothetical protein PM082_024341 [Marasmius tenuissimus]|nr:hypothetical protein PM082_024341 [Marasmius tenuissimus]